MGLSKSLMLIILFNFLCELNATLCTKVSERERAFAIQRHQFIYNFISEITKLPWQRFERNVSIQ